MHYNIRGLIINLLLMIPESIMYGNERDFKEYIVWSSIFEPLMTIFNVNNATISLAFPEINGWNFLFIY